MICLCGKELDIVGKSHYKKCCSKDMSYEDYKYNVYIKNYPKLTRENVCDLYINKEYTLPMFKKEFGCNYKATQYMLRYYDIKQRTIKDSTNLESVKDKFKKTCLEKYGVDNPTRKGTPAYLKREQTVLSRYGSTNIFSSESFMTEMKKDDIWLERYGLTYHQFRSDISSKMWKNISTEHKELWLKKSLFKHIKQETNIEKKFREMLEHYKFQYEPQYFLDGKFFDFYTEGILVEVNGDYYHANKLLYSPESVLRYPNNPNPITAKDIWEKDELKLAIANSNKYDVIYIWENEIDKCKTHLQLYNLFIQRMDRRNIYEQPIEE